MSQTQSLLTTFLKQGLSVELLSYQSLQLLTAVIKPFWLEERFNHCVCKLTGAAASQRCEELLPISMKSGSES